MPHTPLLDDIRLPADLRRLDVSQLRQLADELRQETIEAVSRTGGHLGAGLGVVELTVALHYVFDTPHDRVIWDVGHQAYPHKILTGRRERIRTVRQGGGLSGFTRRSESPFDPFGAAHSSTSISAGLGMAVARDLKREARHVVCVIGDGAMSAGMAYEAMNNAGAIKSRLIVILNDNDMSIAPPVGAMSAYLSRLISSHSYRSLRHLAKDVARHLPKPLERAARRAEEYARGLVTGGTLFEEMGFYYVGPIDGHALDHLLPVLKNCRDLVDPGPVLIHVVTQKGRGYPPAEKASDKYHGVAKFDVVTGAQIRPASQLPSYTQVFAKALIAEAGHDDRVVAITAAMPSGTGLNLFADRFAKRCFDVGIAEQHAVTFAAGLAAEGMKPFAAIYSTFLQRGYDQVVHDVAIQNLPVRLAIDRAGLVGADGATHAGSFDIAFLASLPNFVVMAPADEVELMHAVATAAAYDGGPLAFRYPRGEGSGLDLPERGSVVEIGRGRMVRCGANVALLSLGPRLAECLKAADALAAHGLSASVADARFAKPLDRDLLRRLAGAHDVLITIEEGSIGGFAAHVLQALAEEGLLDGGLKVRPMMLPDRFIDHDTPASQYDQAGLTARHITATALAAMGGRPICLDSGVTGMTAKPPKMRLDQLLVERGLAIGRLRAQALIVAGKVYSGARRLDKAGMSVTADWPIELRAEDHPWVSRGGLKLIAGLERFAINPAGQTAIDIGASTGGFTDVLLERGVAKIFAVDVGHGQLAWKLRQNHRVVVMERTNARYLTADLIPDKIDLVVCDASFIGLRTVLPAALALLRPGGRLVALIKPQFEVGKRQLGKGGIVREGELHQAVCDDIRHWLEQECGWRALGVTDSPILGPKGNREFLIAAVKPDGFSDGLEARVNRQAQIPGPTA